MAVASAQPGFLRRGNMGEWHELSRGMVDVNLEHDQRDSIEGGLPVSMPVREKAASPPERPFVFNTTVLTRSILKRLICSFLQFIIDDLAASLPHATFPRRVVCHPFPVQVVPAQRGSALERMVGNGILI